MQTSTEVVPNPAPSETDLAVARWAAVDQRFSAMLAAGIPTAKALERRGRQLLRENRLPEAMQSFRLATVVEPNDFQCWTNYGVLLERTNALTDAIEALESWTRERNHTLLELAFAWLLGQPAISSVIAGATSPEQVAANAKAGEWQPSAADLAEIDRITAPHGPR